MTMRRVAGWAVYDDVKMLSVPRRPNVFIASSSEGLALAKALQMELEESQVCIAQGWWNVFGSEQGVTNLAQLLDLMTYDFAILLFGREDKLLLRGSEFDVARDNLIFELGFFIGVMRGTKR